MSKQRPGTTPEAIENEMITLAMDMAREQIKNRTASSQVLTHFLKAGTVKDILERERIELELELIKAKTETMKSSKKVEELMTEALRAMKTYTGGDNE